MAGLIGLFLTSLCVIKVVRKSFYHFRIWVSTMLAEKRDGAVQEDRRQAWREGICLESRRAFPPPSMSSQSLRFVQSQRWTIFCLHCLV